jgi:hypothetical protein
MGYTHYWNRDQKTIPQALWNKALEKIRPIVAKHAGLLSDVEVSDSAIFFNGCYETFHIPRVATPANDATRDLGNMWAFCKTAGKAYDPVVVACLVILATTLKGQPVGFTWSSDGTWPQEHAVGLEVSGIPRKEAVGPTK